jgi:hypothetical protein
MAVLLRGCNILARQWFLLMIKGKVFKGNGGAVTELVREMCY